MAPELRGEFYVSTRDVVEKADGVFLWMRLVTEELLKGMGDRCSVSQLKKRLESIPVGLEGMFHLMWEQIDKTEQTRAAQMFLTMTNNGSVTKISAYVFIQAILDDFFGDPRLVTLSLSGSIGPTDLTHTQCIQKCHVAGPRVVARCKGLIEVHPVDELRGLLPIACHYFTFVHRTVADFFKTPEIQSKLQALAGQFCPHKSLLHALLFYTKFVPQHTEHYCPLYKSQFQWIIPTLGDGLGSRTGGASQCSSVSQLAQASSASSENNYFDDLHLLDYILVVFTQIIVQGPLSSLIMPRRGGIHYIHDIAKGGGG